MKRIRDKDAQRGWNRTARQKRRDQHRCGACAEKLPEGCTYLTCEECRKYYRDRAARIKDARTVVSPHESPKWREMQTETRCRCGLLLPCNGCVPSIYAFASQRRGTAGEG